MTTISIERLVIEYRRGGHVTRPIDGLDLELQSGSLTVLLGPSGCGKTSLLSCLAGLMRPAAGRIQVGDVDVTDLDATGRARYARSGVGIVFQAFNLVASLTARENVVVALRGAGVSRRESDRRARELLEDVGLGERLHHRPGQLSGGQMQRVAIARALALDPQIVVADEPTASLDGVQIETVLRLLRRMTASGRSVVVSTHDHRIVPLADTVVDLGVGVQSAVPASADSPEGVRTLAPGERLFSAGDASDVIFEITEGSIVLTGRGEVIAVLGPGDVFGEMGAVFSLPRSATATAGDAGAQLRAVTVATVVRERGRGFLAELIGRRAADPDDTPTASHTAPTTIGRNPS